MAEKFIEDTKDIWSRDTDKALAAAMLKADMRRAAGALKIVDAVLKKQPEDPNTARKVIPVYIALKRNKEAYAMCEKLIAAAKTDRDKISALDRSASVAAQLNDWGKAIAFKERILNLPEVGNSHERAIMQIKDYARKIKEAEQPG